MKTKTFTIALALITVSLSAMAADTAIVVPSNQGKTRDDVKAELKLAIANGEIVHGDLADFYQLLARAPQERTIARLNERVARPSGTTKPEVLTGATEKAPARSVLLK